MSRKISQTLRIKFDINQLKTIKEPKTEDPIGLLVIEILIFIQKNGYNNIIYILCATEWTSMLAQQ